MYQPYSDRIRARLHNKPFQQSMKGIMGNRKVQDELSATAEYYLTPVRLGIDTHQEPVIYMRSDCHVCRSEGFESNNRILVTIGDLSIIATLNVVYDDLLPHDKVGFSEAAWRALAPEPGSRVTFRHAYPVTSMSAVRHKIYGYALTDTQFEEIITDVVAGRYTDIELAAFVSGCTGNRLSLEEIIGLTRAMVGAGKQLDWKSPIVVDKHSAGGLPGNRTSPLVVAIVASQGLTIPKTSSRSITSPSGTADTMETLAPVNLSLSEMRRVVEAEGGCIVWGGSVHLSPADDILIRIERALDLDSEGQLIASVLSKKAAAGSSHVVIDIPVGPTAKVRNNETAQWLAETLITVGQAVNLSITPIISDGRQPVGHGIGPALEAHDVLAVLQGLPTAPRDLRQRAVTLAGAIFEMAGHVEKGAGISLADQVLDSGRAWRKFQAICEAQGGMRQPPTAALTHTICSDRSGRVEAIDNRELARIAKLAGAPAAPAAGISIAAYLQSPIAAGDPLFTVHAQTKGELAYALDYIAGKPGIYTIRD